MAKGNLANMGKKYKPAKSLMPNIYKEAKRKLLTDQLPVIAVLVSDVCYSACRNACRVLMALPNTVFIGSKINIKDPIAYFPDISKF